MPDLAEAVEEAEQNPERRGCGRLGGIADDLLDDLALRAFSIVRHASGDEEKTQALWRLSIRLATLPARQAYRPWHDAMRQFSRSHRGYFADVLGALMPLTEGVGGPPAVGAVWRAVQAAGRWWP